MEFNNYRTRHSNLQSPLAIDAHAPSLSDDNIEAIKNSRPVSMRIGHSKILLQITSLCGCSPDPSFSLTLKGVVCETNTIPALCEINVANNAIIHG